MNDDKLHPFEKAGLGKAPFKFVRMERKVGPVQLGNGFSVGAPGQPMGTCNYCLQGISNCFSIRSADGKEFVVGCDCIEKLYADSNKTASQLAKDPVYQAVKTAKADHDRKVRHDREAKKIAEGLEWANAHAELLKSKKTGSKYRPDETEWDRLEWFMRNAGNKGKIDIFKELRKRYA